MFKSVLAGVILAVCLSCGAAAEPFDDYLEFCMKPETNAQAAEANALAAGWFKVPPEAFDGEEMEFEDPAGYVNFDFNQLTDKAPTDVRMLMTGWGSGEAVFSLEGVRLDFCMIGLASGDARAMNARMADLFDFEPAMIDDEQVWVYSRQGARLQSEAALFADGPNPTASILGRKVFMAGVVQEDGMILLILGAIRPSN